MSKFRSSHLESRRRYPVTTKVATPRWLVAAVTAEKLAFAAAVALELAVKNALVFLENACRITLVGLEIALKYALFVGVPLVLIYFIVSSVF